MITGTGSQVCRLRFNVVVAYSWAGGRISPICLDASEVSCIRSECNVLVVFLVNGKEYRVVGEIQFSQESV